MVCQPDRPSGRGLQTKPPETKVWALANGVEVVQPTKLRDGVLAQRLRAESIDLAVVLAYGRLLPADVLEAPRLGCVNLHASLLPRHRGAAPLNWAILSGDEQTGVTLMRMDVGLDTGPMMATRVIPIQPRETAGTLTPRIAQLCAEITREEIPRVLRGELPEVPQDDSMATWAPPIRAADRCLDFTEPAIRLDARLRALSPSPGVLTSCRGRSLRLLEVLPLAGDSGSPPGTVSVSPDRRICVATGSGTLEVLRAQFEGKKPLSAKDLLNGRSIADGDQLGI